VGSSKNNSFTLPADADVIVIRPSTDHSDLQCYLEWSFGDNLLSGTYNFEFQTDARAISSPCVTLVRNTTNGAFAVFIDRLCVNLPAAGASTSAPKPRLPTFPKNDTLISVKSMGTYPDVFYPTSGLLPVQISPTAGSEALEVYLYRYDN